MTDWESDVRWHQHQHSGEDASLYRKLRFWRFWSLVSLMLTILLAATLLLVLLAGVRSR
jgi:hypothetical protein